MLNIKPSVRRLEPAGSHGVWGLDEYHFFPFLWGAAQLRGHDLVQPKSISNDEVLEVYSEDYMYIDAVLFVRKVKKGPLHETAPMLYDITAVPNWSKVRSGDFPQIMRVSTAVCASNSSARCR